MYGLRYYCGRTHCRLPPLLAGPDYLSSLEPCGSGVVLKTPGIIEPSIFSGLGYGRLDSRRTTPPQALRHR